MHRFLTAAALAAATGACASYSEKVPATYVSPVIYENLSCKQIAEEASRVSRRAAEVAGVQDSQATKDSVVTGVAIVVFWPAAFFVGGTEGAPPNSVVSKARRMRSSRRRSKRIAAFNSDRADVVKTDDPRLEKSHKEALERAEKHRALKLAVVNNHPMFERCVREFLDASGEQHGHLQLRAKLKLCKQLKPAEISPTTWNAIHAACELRDELEHDVNEAQIQAKMHQLRATYLAALTPNQAKAARTLDAPTIAAQAYEHSIGCLVVATEAVKAHKKD